MCTDRAEHLSALDESTGALLHEIADLSDDEVRASALLPGWTRGHVLTHVARNADAMGNLVMSARTRTHIPMYPSRQDRDAAIEAGAGRPAQELRADVTTSSQRLSASLRELTDDDWQAPIRYGAGDRSGEAGLIPGLRRSEVEIHHVDLDLGYTVAHWSLNFVVPMLERVAADFSARSDTPPLTLIDNDEHRWQVRGGGQVVSGPAPALLGWLIGRTDGTGVTTEGELPTLGVWR